MIPNDIIIQADTAEGVWLDKVSVVSQTNTFRSVCLYDNVADIDNITMSTDFAKCLFLAHLQSQDCCHCVLGECSFFAHG